MSQLVNRNVATLHGRSSMRMEPRMWDILGEICRRERLTLGELVRRVEAEHTGPNLSRAVRMYAFDYFRAAATEQGHKAAGHGRLPLQ